MTHREWNQLAKDVDSASRALQEALRAKSLFDTFRKLFGEIDACAASKRSQALKAMAARLRSYYQTKMPAVSNDFNDVSTMLQRLQIDASSLGSADPVIELQVLHRRAAASAERLPPPASQAALGTDGVLGSLAHLFAHDVAVLRCGVDLIQLDVDYIREAKEEREELVPADALSLFLGYVLTRLGALRVLNGQAGGSV